MLNLSKGKSLNLSKTSDNLSHILIGMGWEMASGDRTVETQVPVKSIGNFFRSLFGRPLVTETKTEVVKHNTENYDLDASCAVVNNKCRLINGDSLVYYGHTETRGIKHSGDNLVGGSGKNDDEQINIWLDQVNSNAKAIVVFMNIYSASRRKQNFGALTNAYVRIVNMSNKEELCRYDLTSLKQDDTAIVLGIISKVNGEWIFKAVGETCKADRPDYVVDQFGALKIQDLI